MFNMLHQSILYIVGTPVYFITTSQKVRLVVKQFANQVNVYKSSIQIKMQNKYLKNTKTHLMY